MFQFYLLFIVYSYYGLTKFELISEIMCGFTEKNIPTYLQLVNLVKFNK